MLWCTQFLNNCLFDVRYIRHKNKCDLVELNTKIWDLIWITSVESSMNWECFGQAQGKMGNHIACAFQGPQLSFLWLPPPWGPTFSCSELSYISPHPCSQNSSEEGLLNQSFNVVWCQCPSHAKCSPPPQNLTHRTQDCAWHTGALHTHVLQGWKAGSICVLSLNLSLGNETQRYVKQITWGETWKEQMKWVGCGKWAPPRDYLLTSHSLHLLSSMCVLVYILDTHTYSGVGLT